MVLVASLREMLIPDPEVPQMSRTLLAVPEHSHTGESQSNGFAERSVQLVEDQARTMKAALEDRLGQRIAAAHPLMRWLIHHAATLLTKFHLGADGRTAYMRMHGRKPMERICEFGERI